MFVKSYPKLLAKPPALQSCHFGLHPHPGRFQVQKLRGRKIYGIKKTPGRLTNKNSDLA
jgi:hypothetical protein